jgi:hypothetical protein
MPDLSLLANWSQIIALPIAVLAIAMSVWLYVRSQQRRAISWEVYSRGGPIVINVGEALEGDIEIRYKGESIENLFIVQGELKVNGNMPIRRSHVIKPITFDFGSEAELLREPHFVAKEPEGVKASWRFDWKLLFRVGLDFQGDLEQKTLSPELRQKFEEQEISLSANDLTVTEVKDGRWQIDDSSTDRGYTVIKEGETLDFYDGTKPDSKMTAVSLDFELLNPNDKLVVEFICSGKSRDPKVTARIEGVTEAVQFDSPKARFREWAMVIMMVIALLVFLAFVALLILLREITLLRDFERASTGHNGPKCRREISK